ncbi:MAG: DEAD/DEAH box helicase [Bacteroidales bacterium]|nr:DEAD/DEAH box helicase [Candidatus Cryptobacteroides choladohippi]
MMNGFEEFALSEPLLEAVRELGFENPMPVQSEVIPFLLGGGGDLIALAQTGTGKTAAFGLPVLQRTDLSQRSVQTLILSPTRELCMQIAADLKDYSCHLDALRVIAVYGGASIKNQIDEIRKGVHIVVATPGRLLDLCRRGALDLSTVGTVVMDEADEMLNMGFLEDIDAILAGVPESRSTLLFSATMPEEIEKLSRKYMREPKEIVIGGKNEGTSSVRHIYYTVRATEKYRTLKRVVDFYPRIYGIIFCRTKAETQEVSDRLIKDGYNVDALHGDLSQAQRDNVMQRFRLHNIQLLVATDVAARGLDVDDLTHVINYTLPDDNEVYTHRSGRTGRAGKTGISISIINLREKKRILGIEKTLRQTFEAGRIPTGKEICSKQIFNLMDSLENVEVDDEELQDILPAVYGKLGWLDKEEIIKRLVSLEFHRFLAYYQDDEDFETEQDGSGRQRVIVQREEGFTKLFINIGRMDGMGPKELLGMLNGCLRHEVEVGRIDLFTRYTLFDVKDEFADEVIFQLSTLKLRGRSIKVSLATDEQIDRGNKINQKPAGGKKDGRKKEWKKKRPKK